MFIYRRTNEKGVVVELHEGRLSEVLNALPKSKHETIRQGGEMIALQGGGSCTLSHGKHGTHIYTETLQWYVLGGSK